MACISLTNPSRLTSVKTHHTHRPENMAVVLANYGVRPTAGIMEALENDDLEEAEQALTEIGVPDHVAHRLSRQARRACSGKHWEYGEHSELTLSS